MSDPARPEHPDRQSQHRFRDVADAIDTVCANLVQARSGNEIELSPGAWEAVFAALDALKTARATYGGDEIEGASRSKGLNSSPNASIIAIIAIENFKFADRMNDQVSASISNKILQTLRSRIDEVLGDVTVGRFSQSRIELSFSAEIQTAYEHLVDLHRLLEDPILVAEESFSLDVMIGFSARSMEEEWIGALLEQAEHALSKARHGGAKVVAFNEKDRRRRAERVSLMRDLRTAMPNSELFVCYQPKLELRTLRVSGVEALLRWRHPVRGLVPPDKFIAFAEEGPEIRSLTEFVLLEALARRVDLARAGCDLTIAVNISASLLADGAFSAWAINALEGSGAGISFEITETAVIANPDRTLANIRAFADAGVTISIDDYGSGLSSLIYLKQIPANELKIDKTFVTDLTSSHRDPLLVRSTIDLGHALGMKVTAEGVDNARSFALLQVMGCDMIQGYHVSKPLLFDDVLAFIQQFNPETYKHRPLFGSVR